MAVIIYIVTISILFCHGVRSQFHPYYMDHTTNVSLYYDCLYYKELNNDSEYTIAEQNFKNRYQIIPYCLRPFSEKYNEIIEGNVSSRLTFEELREKQVTTHDLLLWSASIDLVERYDEYLTLSSNTSLRSEMFYNCSLLWFGLFCQYTFDTVTPFDIIVNLTFFGKRFRNVSNMTCYIDLNCNRGPAPACLDWREVCNGKIDCIGNGIDEINCFELEINECEENEFRCRNGLCIPEGFFNEGPQYPDCLDGTDDDTDRRTMNIYYVPYFMCFTDPGFWCEETDFTKHHSFFVCGDGGRTTMSILHIESNPWNGWICRNERDTLMKTSLLSFVEHSDLPYDCWYFLHCTTIHSNGLHCSQICEDSNEYSCYINMKSKCHTDFVIFPQRPVLQGHVLFVYLTNKTIFYVDEDTIILPDYVCYDVKRCPFLPTISSININGTTCRSSQELGLYQAIDILHLFQACLTTSINNELAINGAQASLFQCRGTTKYISKHRVLDGIVDCYNGTDEINIDACQYNHKHRFKCLSEDKCIPYFLLQNSVKDCLGGEDELLIEDEQITFQKFCNGYVHMSPQLINGLNETDETHCNDWPCNNIYNRCDGAWNCPNGADELNCIPSKCPLDTHECVSPITSEVICLPLHLAGNGIVDCLGSTDERAHCRLLASVNVRTRYKCWKETFCAHNEAVCQDNPCRYEKITRCSEDVKRVFKRLNDDMKLQFLEYKYFILDHSTTKTYRSNSTTLLSDNLLVSSTIPPTNVKISPHRAEACNRGILIYVGHQLITYCLCPPSYFGDRCQYQSQRVSLTLQFSRICAQECLGIFGIIITLIDHDNIIHEYEQLTYITTHECENKFYIYLLYQSRRKNMTKNYNVRIDAYNRVNLTYYASWILPVRFLFLPVNKIAAHLIIPTHPVSLPKNCSMFCGHGQCFTYINTRDSYFCRCDPGWSGINCTISYNCDCSSDSKCLGHKNNQSICLCSLEKYGPRCRLQSICRNGTCKNGGQCIPVDERVLRNSFICVCPIGFAGRAREIRRSEIHISFNGIEIPRSLLIHLITVRTKADPMHTTISTKIPYDRDIAIIHISILFHMIIVQISNEYFLGYVQTNYTSSSLTVIPIGSAQKCRSVEELFDDKIIAKYPLLRRVKYYHLLCKKRIELECFHDNEIFMCLCTEERHANCFSYDFNTTYTCKGLGDCENDAECFQDRQNCPYSMFCVCKDCYYGSKCQFTTKGFGLSLDAILGYQILPRLSINRQPLIVKISLAVTVIMLVVGVINGTLSIMAFHAKKSVESGCRHYLFATSIVSLCTTVVFTFKFLILILSQMSLIGNIMFLRISCISIDFLLRLGPITVDWLNASVAIDRSLTVTMSTKFDKKKSKQAVRWVITGILLVSMGSILHDPIHRQLIYDEKEERRWCLVQYSSSFEIYNSAINIIHFIIPFMINFFAAFIIIIVAARKRSTARQQQTYQEHLNEQFHQHKHLIISSITLVILATPRLIISFISGCMKSARNSSFYLMGYFISFIPPFSTFIVFVIPSKVYKKEFYAATKRLRSIIGRQSNVL